MTLFEFMSDSPWLTFFLFLVVFEGVEAIIKAARK